MNFPARLVPTTMALALVLFACGGNDSTPAPDTGTGTPAPSSTASPTATATLFGTFTPTSTPTPSAKQVQIYRNDTYGYSFSVACPPFCQLDEAQTSLDPFRAVASDGRDAWIEAHVQLLSDVEGDGSLEAFHEAWKKEMAGVAEEFKEVSTKGTTLIDRTTPALQVTWTASSASSATGVEATTMLAVSGPLGYTLEVGSPAVPDPTLQEDLDLVLKTFHVEGQTLNLPGLYNKQQFVFQYPPGWEAAESPGATDEQGQVRAGVRPPGPAVVALVTWSTVPAEQFKPAEDIDAAITQAQQASKSYKTLLEGKGEADGAPVTYFLYQDALDDGRPIFAGFGEWFCADSGRVFTMFFGYATDLTPEQLKERFDEFLAGFRCAAPIAP